MKQLKINLNYQTSFVQAANSTTNVSDKQVNHSIINLTNQATSPAYLRSDWITFIGVRMRINKLEAKMYCMEEEEEGKTESVVRLEKLSEDITMKSVKV